MPRVYLSDWYALYIGPSYEPKPHHHFAVQHVVALEQPLRVESDSLSEPMPASAVRVESEVAHSITSEGPIALLLTKPREVPSNATSRRGASGVGVAILEETTQVRAAASTLGAGFDVGSANERAQMISNLFDDHVRKPLNLDSRVLAGLSLIESGGDLDLLAVASEVGLSQDRFRHLFRDEVGIPFSRYLLWARIKRAVWLLRGGGTLTAVLTSAGFSDSAHFSKSFKSLFGIPPSIVLKADGIVDCVPGEQGGIPSIAGG